MRKKFFVSSLLAAGFGSHDPLQAALISVTSTGTDDPNHGKLFQMFRQDHLITLAGHASHSSHSSHSSGGGGGGGHYSHTSHTSHRSGTGGYETPSYDPQPAYAAPSSPAAPDPPSTSPSRALPVYSNPAEPPSSPPVVLRSLSGRSSLFKTIVLRVQTALLGQGIFEGPINGVVGPSTRAALRKFQSNHGLTSTGTITPETLDALKVSSQ